MSNQPNPVDNPTEIAVKAMLESSQERAEVANLDLHEFIVQAEQMLTEVEVASKAATIAHYEFMALGSKDLANRTLIAKLTRGADDSWSGRGNDIKRAAFDGLRAAAQELLD